VFKYCFILIVLGSDTSSQSSNDWQDKGSRPDDKGRSLHICSEQCGN